MNAVITVIGKDRVGILATVSTECAKENINVRDVTQSVLGDIYTLVMLVDISEMSCSLAKLKENIKEQLPTMELHIMHEDIFQSMHSI